MLVHDEAQGKVRFRDIHKAVVIGDEVGMAQLADEKKKKKKKKQNTMKNNNGVSKIKGPLTTASDPPS